MHVHPNCLFSGILYVKTPKNCGPTMFTSPRQLARMFEPAYSEKNELNSDVFVVPPEKGRMLLWPSYLPHAVEQGFTEDETDERIVVAFNIMIRGRIDEATMSLDCAEATRARRWPRSRSRRDAADLQTRTARRRGRAARSCAGPGNRLRPVLPTERA
ncbi:MAG: TIGR02466 family protein [Pseudolabrys sp.]